MKYSVNVCSHCRKQLTLIADKLGMRKCPQCVYFDNIGVYSVKQYNNWLNDKTRSYSIYA